MRPANKSTCIKGIFACPGVTTAVSVGQKLDPRGSATGLTPPRFPLNPGRLSLGDVRAALGGPLDIYLDPITRDELNRSAAALTAAAGGREPVYGLNTGFGKLARTRIPPDKLSELQRNLVPSHAAGVGDPLHEPTVRLILLLKANGLSRGHSGVRAEVVEALLISMATFAAQAWRDDREHTHYSRDRLSE